MTEPERSTYWSNLTENMLKNFARDRWEQRLPLRLKVVELIKEAEGSVLDCGFGSAPFFEFFRGTNMNYRGIDITPEFVEVCKKQFPSESHRFQVGDILNIPFGNEAFTTVFCSSVLEHLPPNFYGKAIQEMVRVAKKQVIIDFFRPLTSNETQNHWNPTLKFWDNQYNRQEITDCIQSIEGVRNILSFHIKMCEGFTDHEIVRGVLNG